MGDCWFLAALAAIIAVGSGGAIKLMMRSVSVLRRESFLHRDQRSVLLDEPRPANRHAMVRLYDSTMNPHYVVVEKSLVATDVPGKTYHSTGAPWVAVLEKAMTAIDTSEQDHPTRGGRYHPRGAHYLRLKSGRSHVAFKALLGVEVLYDILTPGEYHGADTSNPFQVHLLNILSGDPDRRPPPGVMMELFQGLVPQPRAELFYAHAWERFVGAVAQGVGGVGGIEDPFPARVRMTYMGAATRAKPLRQEDFEPFLLNLLGAVGNAPNQQRWAFCVTQYVNAVQPAQGNQVPIPPPMPPPMPVVPPPPPPPPAAVVSPFLGGPQVRPTLEQAVRCVVDWARRQRVFAGVRGTGLYTPAQDNLYRDIRDHLQHYRPVCLGTDEHPGGSPEPGRGGSGEHLSKGLAGPHAYAVLACHETPEGVKYVEVHNPWGHTGRGYTFAPQGMQLPYSEAARLRLLQRAYNPMIAPDRKAEHAYETPAGTFWLELSDLTKRCASLYTCAATPPVIIEGRRRVGLPVPG